jgi:outer membrane protein assembly factor BamB
MRPLLPLLLLVALPASAQQILYSTEGNRLRRFDVDTFDPGPPLEDVLVERVSGAEGGGGPPVGKRRDINGVVCPLPDGSGRFVAGEDSGQPHPKAGWGVFTSDGRQVGKLTPTTVDAFAEPFGCAFAADGTLFTTEVGDQGFGFATGQLIQWFPPFDVFPGPPGAYPATDATSTNYCKIAVDLPTLTSVALDAEGRVLVASPGGGAVFRFAPPFPTGPDAAGGCGRTDPTGAPLADLARVSKSTFIGPTQTPSGLARRPNGHWYVSSVLFGRIWEYDANGVLVRTVMDLPPGEDPFALPHSTGSPNSLALGLDGTLYYADLDLQGDIFSPDTGDDGKLRRIRFDAQGNPGPPEILRSGLAFPDGVALLPGDFEPREWRTYAGGPSRTFSNPLESALTPDTVRDLRTRWRFPTQGAITASPTVAIVDLPGEGPTQVAYFLSWDLRLYAVRVADGSEVWRFQTVDQPGASFPTAASVDVSKVDGVDRVFVGAGEHFYALDAATGQERWRFAAGTGCVDAHGLPPGLCSFAGERNQIESSAIVHGGRVYFGMDVNDVATGKGGFYALDARGGHMKWYFDLESGKTCRPWNKDRIRRFDGYHKRSELGLPPDFHNTRPGCDIPKQRTGCGNVWSSPALDAQRGLLFFGSSNCDTDSDPSTSVPYPPMPAYDEALVALRLDGTPAWRWRPREVDNADLAFGAVPNLFAIQAGGAPRDVVGIGGKDGTYYVVDRDGVNELTGVAWDSAQKADLPYWRTQVVPGGDIGGIIATAAVDELRRRIYFSTAPGDGNANGPPGPPQRPTMHALDMDTGAVVWDNAADQSFGASFGPTSALRGLVFAGHVPFALLRPFQSAGDAGTQLGAFPLDNVAALASAPVVVNGTLLVGAGIGTRTQTGSSPGDFSANTPSDLFALCVPGVGDCLPCADGQDNDGDGLGDHPDDPGCASADDLSEQPDCSDGLENDFDGARDFPADAGCGAASDGSEEP